MRINKEVGYWLAIGLLTVALIGSLTAWSIEYQRNDDAGTGSPEDCVQDEVGCGPTGLEPDPAVEGPAAGEDPSTEEHVLMPFHPVATIDDQVITLRDFYLYASDYYGSSILNQMMDEQVLEAEAKALGIYVKTGEIEHELERMQQGYESEEEFFRTMKEQLGMDRNALERDIRHTLLMEKIATHDIVITDQDLAQYFKERPMEAMAGTQLHLIQIAVGSQAEAEAVIRDIAQGVQFEDLAAAYSDDTMFPNGDLGWVDWEDPFLPAEMMEQARKMVIGQVSPVIALGDGSFALIQLQDKRELNDEEREQMMDRIRMELALRKASSMQDLLIELRIKHNASVIDPHFRK